MVERAERTQGSCANWRWILQSDPLRLAFDLLMSGRFVLVNILVLEDNPLLRSRMVDILIQWSVCTSVKSAATVADCTAILNDSDTDVFLVDLHLPDGSGHECITLFKKNNPTGIPIVISALSDGPSIIKALELGAVGYLHKDDTSFQIVDAVKMALNGQSPMSPSIAYVLVSRIQNSSFVARSQKPADSYQSVLTAREIEVLDMIAKGLSYAETAKSLKMSEQTVPVHIRNIYKKLQATNRSEAVFEARAIGLIE
jgi:DNA-binding NarL/FixJ family response regulator